MGAMLELLGSSDAGAKAPPTGSGASPHQGPTVTEAAVRSVLNKSLLPELVERQVCAYLCCVLLCTHVHQRLQASNLSAHTRMHARTHTHTHTYTHIHTQTHTQYHTYTDFRGTAFGALCGGLLV